MAPGLQLVFRQRPPSEGALALIHSRFAALNRLSDEIVRCHVDVDERCRVFVQLTLLRGDVVRLYDDDIAESDDEHAAIEHAFDSVASRMRSARVFAR